VLRQERPTVFKVASRWKSILGVLGAILWLAILIWLGGLLPFHF
jgi:hypothetical protein